LGGTDAFATGINNAGQVAGRSKTAAGVTHAFVWTPGGADGIPANPQMKDLNPTGGVSQAFAINATGQVAGFLTVSGHPKDVDRAFRYSDGVITQLPLPGNVDATYAYAINDAGNIAGESYSGNSGTPHGFFYNGTSSVALGDLGGNASSGLAINNNDRVVGYSTTGDGVDHAFVYFNGSMTDLGTLGGHYSYANSINNNNQIIGGAFIDDADNIFHAFLSDGASMIDLNSKLTAKAADWVLMEAKSINDNGVIVGVGSFSGQTHAFMLNPLIPGDANEDGKVSFSDFQAIELNFGQPGGWDQGDFNGDGVVDTLDLKLFLDHYGPSAASNEIAAIQSLAASVVPEPAALAPAALALAACSRRRRRGTGMRQRPTT
jgi:probable HAF family extracellular repeat protein